HLTLPLAGEGRGEGKPPWIALALTAGRRVGRAAGARRAGRAGGAARAGRTPGDCEAVDLERDRTLRGHGAARVDLDAVRDRLGDVVSGVLGHRAVERDREVLPVTLARGREVHIRPAVDVLHRRLDEQLGARARAQRTVGDPDPDVQRAAG